MAPSLVFEHVDDDSDLVLGIDGNYWFNERIFGLAGLAVGFDDADVTFTLGAGLNF